MSEKLKLIKQMINWPSLYNEEQLINAIKYAGEIKEINIIKQVINNPLLFNMTLINEALNQVKKISDFSVTENIFYYSKNYTDDIIMKAIELAGEIGNETYLQHVVTFPSFFKPEHVSEATIILFNLPRQTRSLTENIDVMQTKKIKVAISYKTIDKWFANKISEFISKNFRNEFEILFDEFIVYAGNSLPEILNDMLEKYDCSIMIWSPEYFKESGWAKIERDAIIQRRVLEGTRFVPILLRGEHNIIPKIFSPYVPVDFRNYIKTKNELEFQRQMKKVIEGIKRQRL